MSIIIRKISQIIRGQCLLMDEMIDLWKRKGGNCWHVHDDRENI